MSTAYEVGSRLVELCNAGKHGEAIEELYADDAASVEAVAGGPMERETTGKAALLERSAWFWENHEVHEHHAEGPYPMDDRFICVMSIALTPKYGPMEGQRMETKEAALYTLRDGKIAKSEFFYHVPGGDCGGG